MVSDERAASEEGSQRGLNPERRARVLEAAAAALLERGFAETRIADIAERAGMSPGHVMYYFESKERLLLEALRFKEEALFYSQVDDPADGVDPWRRRKLSIEKKINVRFLRMGPPIVPPNSFCRVGAFVAAKNPRASIFSLRKNSNALPCTVLAPLFSVKLVTPASA
jgi:AcrR family transcriptional regulator